MKLNTLEDVYFSKATMALVLTIAGYYAYYFPAFSAKTAQWFQKRLTGDKTMINLFLFQKTLGLLFLGALPALVFFSMYAFQLNKYPVWGLSAIHWWVYALVVLIIISLSFISARKPDINTRIPQMRLRTWGAGEIGISIGGWAIYLLGYEFLFRGLLLFTTAEAFGVMPALLINIGLYSAFHLPNGMKETLAAIPFGFVLCLTSLISGSFLPAFLLHLSLSASAELCSVHFNPGMKFQFSKTNFQT